MYATFFYSKNTGKIKSYCITEAPQDLNYFGEDKVDFELIYDFLVFEYREELEVVMRNRDIFTVDLDTKQIVQKDITLDIKSM